MLSLPLVLVWFNELRLDYYLRVANLIVLNYKLLNDSQVRLRLQLTTPLGIVYHT